MKHPNQQSMKILNNKSHSQFKTIKLVERTARKVFKVPMGKMSTLEAVTRLEQIKQSKTDVNTLPPELTWMKTYSEEFRSMEFPSLFKLKKNEQTTIRFIKTREPNNQLFIDLEYFKNKIVESFTIPKNRLELYNEYFIQGLY